MSLLTKKVRCSISVIHNFMQPCIYIYNAAARSAYGKENDEAHDPF